MTKNNIDNVKLNQHVITTEFQKIIDITSPLRQNFGITHFAYQKLYANNTISFLTTSPLATEVFLKEKFYKIAFLGNINLYESTTILPAFVSAYSPIIQAEINYCKISHHLCIIKKFPAYVEFFFLGTPPENFQINNFYLNNLNILDSFISYFRTQAKDIIKKADNQQIIFPSDASDASIFHADYKKINLIEELIDSNKSHYSFTKRETECLYLTVRGKSAKQISNLLGLSPRTIEEYLANIKLKLHVTSKSALIESAIKLGFI